MRFKLCKNCNHLYPEAFDACPCCSSLSHWLIFLTLASEDAWTGTSAIPQFCSKGEDEDVSCKVISTEITEAKYQF